MKRIFLAVGMVALMLVSGANVYIANQRNEMENNLSLENIEAEGLPFFVEFITDIAVDLGLPKAVNYLTHQDYAHWIPFGSVFTKIEQVGHQIYENWYQPIKCVDGGDSRACIPPHETTQKVYSIHIGTSQYPNYNHGN